MTVSTGDTATLAAARRDSLTLERASARLRLHPRVVLARARAGDILAIDNDGAQLWFPVWQFHRRSTVLGLKLLLAHYPGSPVSLTAWALTPHVELRGSPADELRRGGILRVLAAVKALERELRSPTANEDQGGLLADAHATGRRDSAGTADTVAAVRHRLIDLFAGCGGMTTGFLATGSFDVVQAVESDPDAAHTYATNFGDEHLHIGRIEAVHRFEEADVIVGGPPCQGFSPLNRQREATISRALWREYWRAIRTIRPAAFVMENVPELLRSDEFAAFARVAKRARYRIRAEVLNAADVGVPQRRRRAIVIGVLGLPGEIALPWPRATHADPARLPLDGGEPWVTVRQAFAGLPLEPDGRNWHRARKPRPESVTRYRAVPWDGGNRHQMQAELDRRGLAHLVPRCWREHTTGSHDVFGRLWWDRPAPTIRTEFYKPEKGRYLHPEADRSITIREGALLQSMGSLVFPDEQTMTAVGRQIGNAVPPLLAQRIAEAISDTLRDLHASSPDQTTAGLARAA
jgi:DNA (cytosine-5)-methyltransferase 1